MPVSCCAVGCANRYSKESTVTFHRFPEDSTRRQRWINAVSRDKWILKDHHRLCSDHFVSGKPSKDAKDVDYVPTIFCDGKRRSNVTEDPERAKRAAKRRQIVVEVEEAASILVDLSTSTPQSNSVRDVTEKKKEDDVSRLKSENEALYVKINDLEQLVVRTKQEKEELEASRFGVKMLSKLDDATVKFYTGLPSYDVLMALFVYLKPKLDVALVGRARKLDLEDEFLAVLMRLRLGLLNRDVADRFYISPPSFSRIFVKWIGIMYCEFKQLFPWPSRNAIKKRIPSQFKKYPNTRVIIDCTEIYIQRPSSLQSQVVTFSNYKHHNTFKVLVGISPGGVVTFVSSMWGGRVSDYHITKECGLLDLLEEGDDVMADRGFNIQDLLAPLGVTLNIPPFMDNCSQMTAAEVTKTRRIAEARIHVERAIGRIKTYRILQGVLPISLADIASQIFTVCAYLTNFSQPVV